MNTRPDAAVRKQQREARREAERAARAALPIDAAQLDSLVEFVVSRGEVEGCDHSSRLAQLWANDHGVDWARLPACLEEFGGYCDCEIAMNCNSDQVFR
ncbi:DUF2695 domain-containing protein [Micromonospora sp. DPT]|uniref:DUF2695 domain-containing protein n=1 Tax=Micromonospora sp. DPT TaxID=3142975 RepID=UPI00320831DD